MKPPRFLINLYRDLQDRRLLPVVALLLVAIAVLPIALGQGSETPPPAPAPETVAGAEDIPTLPAVLAADPGLRDYRDRLKSLSSKDPFAQHFSGSSETAVEGASVSKVPSSGGGTSDSVAPAPGSVGGSSASVAAGDAGGSTGTTISEPSEVSTTGEGSTGGGSGGSVDADEVSKDEVLAFRVDVEVGPAGSLERRQDVKLLTVLPSQSNPVLLFLGASEQGDEAVFMVSEDVVTSHGDGSCLPTPAQCQFLNLREGDEQRLEYAPRGEPDTFVIKLVSIRLSPIPKNPKGSEKQERAERSQTQGDLEAWLGL
jgi:hypothetical protein